MAKRGPHLAQALEWVEADSSSGENPPASLPDGFALRA